MQKSELLEKLDHSHADLLALVDANAPLSEWDSRHMPHGWSIKDLFGHFAFWEERARQVCEMLRADPDKPFEPEEMSLDGLNAQAYEHNRDRSAAEVRASEQVAFASLRQVTSELSERDLFDGQRFVWTNGMALAELIANNSSGHFEEHGMGLRSALGLDGWQTFKLGDKSVRVFVARPIQPAPGIILLHAWWGLNPFFQRTVQRLADQGFAVFAPDMYDGKVVTTVEEATAAVENVSRENVQKIIYSALPWAKAQAGVLPGPFGVIGFSFGAAWSGVLSVMHPDSVSAVALFYGSVAVPFERAKAAYQCHFAENDVWEPKEEVEHMLASMKTAGREVTDYTYPGTGHWFMEDDRPDAYRPEAAQQAWERTLAFFTAKLK